MPLRLWARAVVPLLAGALISASAGCGPGNRARATIKGQVTHKGKKLTAGTVLFQTKDNRTGAAPINADGSYLMTDAPVGEVVVTVSVPKMTTMMPGMPRNMPKPPPGVPLKPPDGSGPGMVVPKMPNPGTIVRIPNKYANPETSGLAYTVEKGEHVHNIDLP